MYVCQLLQFFDLRKVLSTKGLNLLGFLPNCCISFGCCTGVSFPHSLFLGYLCHYLVALFGLPMGFVLAIPFGVGVAGDAVLVCFKYQTMFLLEGN